MFEYERPRWARIGVVTVATTVLFVISRDWVVFLLFPYALGVVFAVVDHVRARAAPWTRHPYPVQWLHMFGLSGYFRGRGMDG